MLQTNQLKIALHDRRPVFGLINALPVPLLVEMMGYAGYDFVILDMEHLSVNPETLENLIRAAELSGITPLVRVPAVDPALILRVLDAGAQGILAANVKTADEARRLVAASHYHPRGQRGISGGRTTGFGTLDLPTYLRRAGDEILVGIMIEDIAAVRHIDDLLATPGVDFVLEGAIDLSQSLGVPADHQHPDVQAAIHAVAGACRRHRIPFCAIPRLDGQLAGWLEKGVHMFLVGDDRSLSFKALKRHRDALNAVLQG